MEDRRPSPEVDPPRRRSGWTAWLAVLAIAGLVLLPAAAYGLAAERLHWQLAQLAIQDESGQHAVALKQLQQLLAEHPDFRAGKRRQAIWLLENDQPLDALQVGVALLQDNPNDLRMVEVVLNAQIDLDLPQDALELFKKYSLAFYPQSTGDGQGGIREMGRRNGLAYYRALAKTELELAEKDVQYVFRNLDRNWQQTYYTRCLYHARPYLLAAIVYADADQPNEALEMINAGVSVVSHVDVLLQEMDAITPTDSPPLDDPLVWHPDTGDALSSSLDSGPKAIDRTLALLRSMRALIHQQMGNEGERLKDIQRVLMANFDPETLLQILPDARAAATRLAVLSAYLDTRACVNLARRDFGWALLELDAAIAAHRAYMLAIDRYRLYEAQYDFASDYQIRRDYVARPRRTLATYLYHRHLVWRELSHHLRADGQQVGETVFPFEAVNPLATRFAQRAQRDRQTIQKMGFQFGPTLNR